MNCNNIVDIINREVISLSLLDIISSFFVSIVQNVGVCLHKRKLLLDLFALILHQSLLIGQVSFNLNQTSESLFSLSDNQLCLRLDLIKDLILHFNKFVFLFSVALVLLLWRLLLLILLRMLTMSILLLLLLPLASLRLCWCSYWGLN